MKGKKILVTGSQGLVGTSVCSRLQRQGALIKKYDVCGTGDDFGDIRSLGALQTAIRDCSGVIHLAAVSRVIWGEKNPEVCWETNVGGLRNVLDAARLSPALPWVIFASSREVYGEPDHLPVTEDCPLRPINVYGRSKVEGELLVDEARLAGVRACTIRLSNVFGSTTDHADRVVPAFARAAVLSRELRVDGMDNTFDFTHIEDVTRGIASLASLLDAGELPPPPIHFVSGTPTTLGVLANLAVRLGQSDSVIRAAAPRDFDVARFFGNPARAKERLGWRSDIRLEQGVARLIQAFRAVHHQSEIQETPQ